MRRMRPNSEGPEAGRIWGIKNKTAATVRKPHTNDRRISSLPPCWPAWRSNELGGRSLGYYFGSGRIATAAARTGDLQPYLVAGHCARVRGHHGVAAHVLGGLEGNVVARYCAFGDRGVHGGAVTAGPGTVAHQFAALGLKGKGHFRGSSISAATGLFIDPLAVDVGRHSGERKDKQKSGSKKQLFCHLK